MMLFDSETRNTEAARKAGVPTHLVRFGMTLQVLKKGLDEFAKIKNEEIQEWANVDLQTPTSERFAIVE